MRLCKLSASEPLSSILLIPTFFLLSPPRPPPRSGAIVKRRPFFGPLMASRSQMAAFGGGPIRGVESKVLALLGSARRDEPKIEEKKGDLRRSRAIRAQLSTFAFRAQRATHDRARRTTLIGRRRRRRLARVQVVVLCAPHNRARSARASKSCACAAGTHVI